MAAQTDRLQALLLAKNQYDDALAVVDQCENSGALTSMEAHAQRQQAHKTFQRAKDAAIASENAAIASGNVLSRLYIRRAGDRCVAVVPKKRERPVGSKNIARTRIDDLSDETLHAIVNDLGLLQEIERSDRTEVILRLHQASGVSSRVPTTNLDPLSVETLKRICADRKLDDNGDNKTVLVERICYNGTHPKSHEGNEKERRGCPKDVDVTGFGALSSVKTDGTISQPFPLVECRYLVGRADYCDIRINSLTASREHAEIIVDEKNQVWVTALSRTLNTTVNNTRVDDKILLKDNDLIEIGQRKFIFHSLTPRMCDEPKKKRAPTAYNLFMKEEIARLKEADSSLSHKEAFKKAADNWAAERIRRAFEQLDAANNANNAGAAAREKSESA